MELNISIASTSFLLPKNPAWRALGDLGRVSFADYGDYVGAFLKSAPDEPLVFVLFVQDLLRDPDVATKNADYGLLQPLIALIESRIARSTAPTIIAAASWLPRSVINTARGGDLCEVMGLELWRSLHRLRESSSNVFTINLDRYLGADGFARAFDTRNWYFAHCRLSQHGLSTLAKLVTSVFERLSRPRKKVLVLDCDNTLWGGVVGEEGVDGIALGEEGIGAAFVDFQRASKKLAESGVLLALSSKNNEAEVWEVFDRHASMVLARNDLVTARINWNDKAQNLREIADELDLSLDSFVFWDDSPFERAMLKDALPMVEVVDVPNDVTSWPRLLATLDALQSLSYTTEDRKKTTQYRARADFSRGLAAAQDTSNFLASIKMVPAFHSVNEATIIRAHQLVSKTNQFNLRSIRYTKEEVFALAADARNLCLLGSLSDIYGDHGLVALVVCRTISERIAFLDTLLMSCRVLGRRFETWILATLARRLRDRGIRYLLGEYIPTPRNQMCAAILDQHNFSRLTEDHIRTLNLRDLDLQVKGVGYLIDLDTTEIPFDATALQPSIDR